MRSSPPSRNSDRPLAFVEKAAIYLAFFLVAGGVIGGAAYFVIGVALSVWYMNAGAL
ncbi:MAG: hypothetical protein AAGH64_07155 [Planctomycetota bacterium]